MENNKTDLQKLAEIVSSETKIAEYDEKKNELPSKYEELIKIDKAIIDILNEMEGKKPMEYELLGKFQKKFLLNKNDLNRQIKISKNLSNKISTLYKLEKIQEEKRREAERKAKAEADERKQAEAEADKRRRAEEKKRKAEERRQKVVETKKIDNHTKVTYKLKFIRLIQDLKRQKSLDNIKNINFESLSEIYKKKIKNIELIINKFKKPNIVIEDEDTLEQIFNKLFDEKWDTTSTLREISNKYIKLLKDINYIKKYMKYKMKYNILLQK